ncbi:MAG: HlyC/CorC family transporter [Chitinophagaceae bacterium]|jgi:putative hemolysin|nr:HlyC/CorC family transporter [Chitinophagaceae bacterium]NBY25158.1 HlyC/CorC family transporter [Chitinophagaceae bacterium]NDB52584.1 HlyC/CorC family transporter [Chitinophagaceae bacterium]
MDLFILGLLILLNGLFSLSEIALVSARKARLEHLAEKGNKRAQTALELSNHPEFFLSAVQIGITLISILTGVYSGEKFSANLLPYLMRWGIKPDVAETLSTILIVIFVTFLSIIFGELIPKRIGLIRAEKLAMATAGPMKMFAQLTYPIVWLLNESSSLFFKLFKIRKSANDAITEEEIKTLITEGTEAGTIEEEEQEIIERVFHLSDRTITSLMTHRSDIIWFDENETEEQIKEKIIEAPHSAYPICQGSIDTIKGVVSIKDLYVNPDNLKLGTTMQPALFIPENISAYQVLERFKTSKVHSAFIVDEYGSILGMLTLNDILEAIVGEIPQEEGPDYEITERENGSFLIDAQIPFYDFLSKFEKTEWMNEGEQDFDTLAGFILHQLERIPKTGEKLVWKGFSIEIVDMDGHRIDKVLVEISDSIREEMEE